MSSSHQKWHPYYADILIELAEWSRFQEVMFEEIRKYCLEEGEFYSLDERYKSAKGSGWSARMVSVTACVNSLLATSERQRSHYEDYNPYNGYRDSLPQIHEAHDEYFEYVTAQYKTIELKGEKESDGQFKSFSDVTLDDESLVLKPFKMPPVRQHATVCTSAEATEPQRIACTVGYDYSKTKFVYADDGSPIDNGGILFWAYNSNYDYTKETDETNRHQAYRLTQGLTSPKGYLVETAHDCLGKLTAEIAKEDPDLAPLFEDDPNHVRYYQSAYTPFDDTDLYFTSKGFSPTLNKADNFAFMLYPADGGEFISKPLSELITMQTPSGAQVVFTDNSQSAPAEVRLHCTLPQWNKRLQKAVEEVNKQVRQYSAIIAPHLEKKALLQAMSEVVELHCKHGYVDFDDLVENAEDNPDRQKHIIDIVNERKAEGGYKRQVKARHKLLENVAELESGITQMVEAPTADNPITKPYHMEQQHIEVACDKLWALFNAQAFRDELSHYLEYVNTLDEDDLQDDIPAGPYMQGLEQGWDDIFITIAECYAALSNVVKYHELLWDNEIKTGIDWLCNVDPDDGLDQAMFEQIEKYNPKNEGSFDKDLGESEGDIPKYQGDVAEKIRLVTKAMKKEGTRGTFEILLEDGLTPILSHVVPGLGAPCSLQVILALFEDEVGDKLTKDAAAAKNTSGLIRFSHNVTKTMLGGQTKAQMQGRVAVWKGKLDRAKSEKSKAKARRCLERAKNKLAAINKMDLTDEDLTKKVNKSLIVSKNKEVAVKRINVAKNAISNRVNALAAQHPKSLNSIEPPFKYGGETKEQIKARYDFLRRKLKNAKTDGNKKQYERQSKAAETKLKKYDIKKSEAATRKAARKAREKKAQALHEKKAAQQAEKQRIKDIKLRFNPSAVSFTGTAGDSDSREGANKRRLAKFDNKLGGAAKVIYQWYNFALLANSVCTEKEKDPRHEKNLKDYVVSSVDIINLGSATATSFISIGNWIVRFEKELKFAASLNAIIAGPSSSIINVLNKVSIVLGLISTVISGYEAIEHFNNKDYKRAARASLSAIASGLMTVGFMAQYLSKRSRSMGFKLARRTALRFARTAAVSGLALVSGVGTIFSPFILFIGTVVNVCLLVWDVLSIITKLTSSSSEQFLEGIWTEFKRELSIEQYEDLMRETFDYRDSSYYSDEGRGKFHKMDPYALYSDRYKGAEWPGDDDSQAQTVEPAKIIDDIHEDNWYEWNSVTLDKLSWHAVIPLYRLGFVIEQIDKFVKIKHLQNAPGLISMRQPLISCAQDIIDYYEDARTALDSLQSLLLNPVLSSSDKESVKKDIREQFYTGTGNTTSIIEALQTGDFMAPEQVMLGHLSAIQKAEVAKDYEQALDAEQCVQAKDLPTPVVIPATYNPMMDAGALSPHVIKDKTYLKEKAEIEAENQRIKDFKKAKQNKQDTSEYKDLALADEKAESYDSHYKRQCTMYKWQAWADLVYTLPDIDSSKSSSNEIKNSN